MSKSRWFFVLIIVFIIGTFFIHPVFAGPDADNTLDLNVHNKGENVGISIFSSPPPTSGARSTLRSGSSSTTITIDTPINKNIVDSWLYIYLGGYDTETFSTIKVNGNTIIGNEHTIPAGEDNNRQLLRVDNVTQYIKNTTEVKFTITGFGSSSEIYVDGASLVVTYEDGPLREYWIYDGTEYLSAKKAAEGTQQDISSTRTFLDPQYTSPKSAELYVAYHNFRQPDDKLEFNGNVLDDASAVTLADTDYLNINKFDVKELLSTSNTITFTSPKFSETDIYPAIALLSIETQDTTPPSVTITSPTNGSLVSGEIEITGIIDDPTATVSLLIDGTQKSTSIPYTWDTTSVSDGSYEINLTATDPATNSKSKIVTVKVDNTPPSVSITSPTDGSDVEGLVEIAGEISDVNLNTTSLKIDGVEVSTSMPYSWNTSSYSNGTHTLDLTATDKRGNNATISINVNVITAPITTPPPTTSAPTTTPPPSTLPPSTVVPTTLPPQTTAPPIEKVDLGIQILSVTPQTANEGEEVEIKLLVINYIDKITGGKVELYVGDDTFDRLKSERVKIDALESKTIEYMINIKNSGAYQGVGRYDIKAVVDVGLDVVDSNEANNEDLDHLNIEKKSRISLAWLWPILKWVVIIAVIIAVIRVIQVQMSPERDYLR